MIHPFLLVPLGWVEHVPDREGIPHKGDPPLLKLAC